MTTLAELNALVDRILRDDAGKVTSAQIDAAIQNEAIQLFSQHRPLRKVSDISANGTYDYTINTTNFPSWVDGFSYIKEVEYPAGQYQNRRNAIIPFEDWEIYEDSTTQYLRFLRITPTSGYTIRSTYFVPHSVPDSTAVTIKATDEGAFCNLAASLCAVHLAGYYGQTSDSTMGADAVAYRDKGDLWRAQAKRLYEKYISYMFPDHLEAAMSFKEFDTIYGELQYSRLTHKEWTR